MPNQPTQSQNLVTAKIAAGLAGATEAYFFPLNQQNLTPDRALCFVGGAGFVGHAVGINSYNSSSFAFSRNGVSAAVFYKLIEYAFPIMADSASLILLAGLAPTVIEESLSATQRWASNAHTWWNNRNASSQFEPVATEDNDVEQSQQHSL